LLTSDSRKDERSKTGEVLGERESVHLNPPSGKDISEEEGEREKRGAVKASASDVDQEEGKKEDGEIIKRDNIANVMGTDKIIGILALLERKTSMMEKDGDKNGRAFWKEA
jgi:hypothetical protein